MDLRPVAMQLLDQESLSPENPILQRAIADATPEARTPDGELQIDGADLANVLLRLLATVLELSPAAATPAGMRKLAEVAGKELHQLMRDTRSVRMTSCHCRLINVPVVFYSARQESRP